MNEGSLNKKKWVKNNAVLIGATGSGVGKTSVALGIARALRRKGLRVQTFKVGPDFLDPSYLQIASGRTCYNLDTWMCSPSYVKRLFEEKKSSADFTIVEGVMGLFDGANGENSQGSSAEIAKILNLPVLLLVNSHGVARSLAATVKGFSCFEDDLEIAGVIANYSGSERHRHLLATALASANLPALVGAIPRGALPELKSRHLGLVTATETEDISQVIDNLAENCEQYLNLDSLFSLKEEAGSLRRTAATLQPKNKLVKIGIARDEAFHFYYSDNLEVLERAGAELIFFSPLRDKCLPEVKGLYLGGGYPEIYASTLSANRNMLAAIREFAEKDRVIYAECGGLMYLAEALITSKKTYKMAGILPLSTRMLAKRKTLGYIEVEFGEDTLLGNKGEKLRGHEFHYSEFEGKEFTAPDWKNIYLSTPRRDGVKAAGGYQKGNILASYLHLHFANVPGAADNFISKCKGEK